MVACWLLTPSHAFAHLLTPSQALSHLLTPSHAFSPDLFEQILVAAQNEVKAVALPGGGVSTFAGHSSTGSTDGVGDSARFNRLYGMTLSADGSKAFAIDLQNKALRQIDVASRAVTTITTSLASLSRGVAVRPVGSAAMIGGAGS